MALEDVDDFAGRATRQKRLEHQRQASLRFLVGHLEPLPLAIADEPRGQCQGQRAPLRLVQEAGGEAGCHGVALPFREGALQAQEEPAVDGRRIIDAIAIRHQAPFVATQVHKRRPVGAVA